MTAEQERRAIAMLDGLIPVPRLERPRVRCRIISRARLTWQVDRFTEGTVYRVWIGWLFISVRKPSR